jgi:hypothetical protein
MCLSAAIFIVFSISTAQEESDAGLEKKYAPILGEYEFVTGGGSDIILFYIEEGDLWADSGDGRPQTLQPDEDEMFSFTAQDPINGEFEIKFLKDEQDEYTICQIANAAMGLELEGTKIK